MKLWANKQNNTQFFALAHMSQRNSGLNDHPAPRLVLLYVRIDNFFLRLILCLVLAGPAVMSITSATAVAAYYVAPGGLDTNPGTADLPWATLQHAAETVGPGDHVLVQDGAYAGFLIETSGTADNPITFQAMGTGAVINTGGPTGDGVRLQNVNHITIEGFHILNMTERGIAHRGATATSPVQGLIIRGNTIVAAARENMYLSQVSHSLIENNVVQDATGHGIYLSNAGSDHTILRGNRISGSGKAGIHFNGDLSIGGDGIISGLTVENNIIHHGGQNALNMDGVQNSLIRNNLLYANASNGIRAYRIDGAQGPRGLRIINNTIHVPADGYWCVRITEDLGDLIAFNNILMNEYQYGGSLALDGTNGFAGGYNAVVDFFTTDRGDTTLSLAQWQQLGYGHGSFVANAETLFRDATNGDYRLKSEAPVINTGVSLFNGQPSSTIDIQNTPRSAGPGVDIGAYER